MLEPPYTLRPAQPAPYPGAVHSWPSLQDKGHTSQLQPHPRETQLHPAPPTNYYYTQHAGAGGGSSMHVSGWEAGGGSSMRVSGWGQGVAAACM